jgi:hypothetical protein
MVVWYAPMAHLNLPVGQMQNPEGYFIIFIQEKHSKLELNDKIMQVCPATICGGQN